LLPLRCRRRCGLERKVPRLEVFVIFVVTALSNWPGSNIAYAVGAGVAICALGYAWRDSQQFSWKIATDENGVKHYDITGPLFFGSSNRFSKVMDPDKDPDRVMVHFSSSTSLMDYSAMETLHKIAISYQAKGKKITFESLDPRSERMVQKAHGLVGGRLRCNPKEMQTVPLRGMVPRSAVNGHAVDRHAVESHDHKASPAEDDKAGLSATQIHLEEQTLEFTSPKGDSAATWSFNAARPQGPLPELLGKGSYERSPNGDEEAADRAASVHTCCLVSFRKAAL